MCIIYVHHCSYTFSFALSYASKGFPCAWLQAYIITRRMAVAQSRSSFKFVKASQAAKDVPSVMSLGKPPNHSFLNSSRNNMNIIPTGWPYLVGNEHQFVGYGTILSSENVHEHLCDGMIVWEHVHLRADHKLYSKTVQAELIYFLFLLC